MTNKKSEAEKKNSYESLQSESEAIQYEPKESAKNKTKGTGIPGRETL